MGVKNLWDILESCKKTLPLNHLQNKRVCVDLSCWMVQLHNVNKSHRPMKDKLYLSGLFHRLRALIALNCSIIFVTDGSIPAIKVATYRRRLNSESGAAQDESCSNAATSLRRNMGSEFSCMIKEAKLLGMALGIPCLDGIEEGEAQCALLDSESLCDGCFSSDSDIFLFGAKTVYREICLGEGGYVVCYEMADIERKLGYGRNSLITLAILLGCDYTQGVRGLGAESACQIVKSMGESVVLQQIASDGLAFMKKAKSSRKHGQVLRCNDKENNLDHVVNLDGNKHITQGNSQFLQVIDAYLKPKCHSADSEAVSRVLCTHPFQHTKLQQICSQFFEWSPDKTDEYILPKIAERELRRFANLRATSSELGVHIPLDKMPVKCPTSGIIKRRKAHGIEFFEVTWEEIHGVKSSIVPADLIVSACPEMIQKFEEMKAEKRKPKQHRPRLKKSEKNKLSMSELDTKLQQLVLDIELETNPAHSSSLLGEATLDNKVTITETYEAKQDPVFDAPSNCEVVNNVPEVISLLTPARPLNRDFLVGAHSNIEVDRYASKFCNFRTSQVLEEEVIDLLSPDPSMPECGVSKCHAKNLQCVDVINLSESETDASPEHARKARELRLFVASIREDIS